jgi:hypothetical protein
VAGWKKSIRLRFGWALARYCAAAAGHVALTTAISLPVALLAVGAAIDYSIYERQRSALQAVADAAAIAGAREVVLSNADARQIEASAAAFVESNMSLSPARRAEKFELETTLSQDLHTLTVTIRQYWNPTFAHLFAKDVTPIVVDATARLVGSEKICLLALDEQASPAVRLRNYASLTGNGCGVFANSRSSGSLQNDGNGTMRASIICTVGGVQGSISGFDPRPVTDCPRTDDPLADRAPPSFSGCSHSFLRLTDKVTKIRPGTYCGGLRIDGSSRILAEPGVYVIKDGPLKVTGRAQLTGTDVGFYLTGKGAVFEMTADTTIDLEGPRSGAMAGLLFYENRSNTAGSQHRIESNNAHKLLGTIYLPQGTLLVDANAPVADRSAYTAIIARSLQLEAGPLLQLNSDYDATNVPVPKGLIGGRVVLTD